MTHTELRPLLEQDPLSFTLVCQFNRRPALYLDRRRTNGLVDDRLFTALLGSSRARKRLSDWLLGVNQIDLAGCFDVTDPRRRLVLLEPERLKRLLMFAGAMKASSSIARVVDRKTLTDLKAAIGEDLYLFAIKRAPFLFEVSGGTVACDPPGGDWKGMVRRLGCQCLEECFAGEPASLTSRLLLKFGPDWPLDFSRSVHGGQREAAWRILRKIVTTEIAPGGAPCCNG